MARCPRSANTIKRIAPKPFDLMRSACHVRRENSSGNWSRRMAQIIFENVSKHYPDGLHAVRSLDLTIEDGEFLVLVGPSGCGKSTALRMVAGLEDISDGKIMVGGAVANDLSPRERNIAMVFQSYALYPHLTVAENIGFGLRVRGVGKAEIDAKVKATAEILELSDYLHRKPAQLS